MAFWRRRKTEDRALQADDRVPLTPGPGGGRMSPARALGLADVYACVRVLAESAAALPLVVYRKTEEGRQRLDGGRLARLVEQPAPGVTTSSFVGTIMASLLLHGNCYVGKLRDPGGEVVQLVVLDPGRVLVKVERGEIVYQVALSTGVVRATIRDILHIRALSQDGIVGMSPIRQVREALRLNDQLGQHARHFAENRSQPGGVLEIPGTANRQDVQDRAQAGAELKWGGENIGKVAVLSGTEVKFTQMALTMADAQFVEQRRLSTVEVSRIFRVPAWMISAETSDSLTYSNAAMQADAFVKFSLEPWLVAIEQALSLDADLAPATVYTEFLRDALLRGDAVARSEVYTRALDPATGWLTREEVRRMENLPPETDPPGSVRPTVTVNGNGQVVTQ